MNRLIAIIAFALAVGSLFYAGCSAQGAQAGAAPPALIALQATARNTTAPTSTVTPIPTATVGYQATIDAMAADNLQKSQEIAYLLQTQTWATAEADRRAHELVLLTAQSDMLTATAALTAIPATETRQAIQNTQIAGNATLVVGQWTATAGAPTQAVAMARAQAEANTADLRATADAVSPLLGWLFGLLVVGGLIGIVLSRSRGAPSTADPADEAVTPAVQPAASVRLDYRDPAGFGHVDRYGEPPGDPNAFTILAHKVRAGEKGLKINDWEGKDSPYSRATYKPVYNWLWQKRFIDTGVSGKLELTHNGEIYFDAWLENHYSPAGFASPDHSQNPDDFSHGHDSHAHETPGEVVGEGEPFPAG